MEQKFENIPRLQPFYKFSDSSTPLNERIAVLDFSTVRKWGHGSSALRKGMYCFFLLSKGEAEVTINGYRTILKPRTLACGIPGDLWHWNEISRIEGKFILFEAPFILAGLKGGYTLEPISFLNSESHYPFIPLTERRYHRLAILAEDMEECLTERPVFYDLLRAQLWQFIFLTEKEYVANGNPGRNGGKPNYITLFITLVNDNYWRSHETSFYADKLNITPNYLNKLAKAALGTNAYQYILNRTLSEAKILLRLTDVSVNELSHRLGFETPGYFIRCFKRAEGITPLEYRKKGSL